MKAALLLTSVLQTAALACPGPRGWLLAWGARQCCMGPLLALRGAWGLALRHTHAHFLNSRLFRIEALCDPFVSSFSLLMLLFPKPGGHIWSLEFSWPRCSLSYSLAVEKECFQYTYNLMQKLLLQAVGTHACIHSHAPCDIMTSTPGCCQEPQGQAPPALAPQVASV